MANNGLGRRVRRRTIKEILEFPDNSFGAMRRFIVWNCTLRGCDGDGGDCWRFGGSWRGEGGFETFLMLAGCSEAQ
jgi:hypothetical protein